MIKWYNIIDGYGYKGQQRDKMLNKKKTAKV